MPETPSIAEWLFKELKEGDIIGMDGWVNGIDFKESLYEACSPKGIISYTCISMENCQKQSLRKMITTQ